MPTVGVVLTVPEPWGGDLQRYRAELGDPQAYDVPTHITLVPPVAIGDHELGPVVDHLASVAARTPSYAVHLRGTSTFRPVSPVVFVALVEGISQTEALADDVRRGALDTALDFPFHPHVTIAHHLDEDALDRAFKEQAGFECHFEVDRIHLYVHESGVGWQPTGSFALCPGSEEPRPDGEAP